MYLALTLFRPTSTNFNFFYIMAKAKKDEQDDDGNLLSMLMSQASDLDLSDPNLTESEQQQDPRRLIVDGFE